LSRKDVPIEFPHQARRDLGKDGKIWILDNIIESISFGACGSHTVAPPFDPAPSYNATLIEEL